MLQSKNLNSSYEKGTFAKNINQARIQKDILQIDLAKATGLTTNAISRYESGDAVPTVDRAIAIADYFNMSLDALTGRTAYCAGELSSPADAAKMLVMLEKLNIVSISVNEDASYQISIIDDDVSRELFNAKNYLNLKDQGKPVIDGEYDSWYDKIYSCTETTEKFAPIAVSRKSNKYIPFPQNMLVAAFQGEYDEELSTADINVEKLLEAIQNIMPQRIYDVLLLRFRDKQTLEEISNPMGCTRERIRQIEIKGLRYIREKLDIKKDVLGID